MNKIERIQKLAKELNQYRNEYYNLNNPSVSDSIYDTLFDELQQLEQETGIILSNSPTQTVGYEVVSKLQKRVHPTPLKSLDKTKSIDELNKWKNNQNILLMSKGDGLTVEVNYDNGVFVGAYTRGNSEVGEDISHNAHTFKNLPLKIPFKGKLRVVGEAIIHWNDFNEIVKKLREQGVKEENLPKTPRNLVAGSCRQLNSKICTERNVYFYTFNLLESSEELNDSKYKNFNWLYILGFGIIPTINCMDNKNIEEIIEELKNRAKEINLPIDGLVASFDSIKYSQSLGETSHHPLHSIAFKFTDETEETILRSVEWNTTRSGQINPTAIFDTVILDNTKVSRASLFNLTFIKDLQLNLTNRIKVSKRNMIIPYIEENLDRQVENYISTPSECPSCGEQTEIWNTGTADFLYCTNTNCTAQLLDKFTNFVKRDAMNIDGLSEATLEKFIKKGWLKYFDDIYRLDQHKSQIIKMEGFGQKSYTKLMAAIENSKNVKFENFITALGIEGVGVSTGKLIAKRFKTIDNFLSANRLDFLNIEGIGEITANAIYNYRLLYVGIILYLKDVLNIMTEQKKEVNNKENPFYQKHLYPTGKFSLKKDELKIKLEELGAIVESGYKKSLDILIAGGDTSKSGKVDRAKSDGIKIVTEEYLMQFIKL